MEQTLDAPSHPMTEDIYAGFWLRVVASIIDSFIVSFILGLFIVPLMFFFGVSGDFQNYNDDAAAVAGLAIMGVFVLLGTIGVWLYFALMESGKNQATLGKMALGIKVTDLDGQRISFANALGRTVAKLLSSIFYIGYIMVAFTDKKQGLHDMIANCLVIRKDANVTG